MRRNVKVISLFLAGLVGGCSSAKSAVAPPAPAATPVATAAGSALDPYAQAQALGRGVNLGNLLDADPAEGAWTGGRLLLESDFDLAKRAGFASVRIPVRFSAHARSAPPYTIDAAFLDRVEKVVGWGLSRGLRIVLDVHHYEELHKDPAAHRARFVAIWTQLATRFRDAPDGLYLELLNEPSQQLTAPVWNDLVAETLQAIRKIDRRHTVVVGCVDWSNPGGLEGLRLPDEETNAIVTFHYYTPHLFTFQGKPWMGVDFATTGVTWPGPPATPVEPVAGAGQWVKDWFVAYNHVRDSRKNPGGEGFVRDELARAAAWGKQNHRPLWMGEFTAQNGADLASRARWLTVVRTELDALRIPWSFWSLNTDSGSRLFESTWTPELTRALGLEVKD